VFGRGSPLGGPWGNGFDHANLSNLVVLGSLVFARNMREGVSKIFVPEG